MAGIPQSEAEVGEIAPVPGSGGRKPMPIEGRVIRGTKGVFWWVLIRIFSTLAHTTSISFACTAPDIPIFERKNWLIHLHYIRKDFETCKVCFFKPTTDHVCTCMHKLVGGAWYLTKAS